MLHGEHVDLYYYPEEEPLARVALTYAEESYRELEARFRHTAHAAHPVRRLRVALRFRTDQLAAVHAARGHPRLHRIRAKPGGAAVSRQLRPVPPHHPPRAGARLPALESPGSTAGSIRGCAASTFLWWTEGSAEYFSDGQDTQDDMINRELTQSGGSPDHRPVELRRRRRGLCDRRRPGAVPGESATASGGWSRPMMTPGSNGSFEELLVGIFGKPSSQLTLEWWQYTTRRRYLPAGRDPAAAVAHRPAARLVRAEAGGLDASRRQCAVSCSVSRRPTATPA